MWPEEMRLRWERANYAGITKTCEDIGWHRFGMIHLLREDQSVQYRSCKRCGVREFAKIMIVDGKIIEHDMEIIKSPAIAPLELPK